MTVKSIGGRTAVLCAGVVASGSRLVSDMDRGAASPGGIHSMVFVSFLACLVVMMASYFVVFWGQAEAVFAVTISTGFMVVSAPVPVLMLRFEMKGGPVFGAFLNQKLPTWSGMVTGRDVWIQVCLVQSMRALCNHCPVPCDLYDPALGSGSG